MSVDEKKVTEKPRTVAEQCLFPDIKHRALSVQLGSLNHQTGLIPELVSIVADYAIHEFDLEWKTVSSVHWYWISPMHCVLIAIRTLQTNDQQDVWIGSDDVGVELERQLNLVRSRRSAITAEKRRIIALIEEARTRLSALLRDLERDGFAISQRRIVQ